MDIFGPLPSVVVVSAYFPFNVNLAFIVEKLSADHEICWLPVLEYTDNTGFLLRSHREYSCYTPLFVDGRSFNPYRTNVENRVSS